MHHFVSATEDDAVFGNGRRGKVRKIAVAKCPGLLAFFQIDAEKLILELAKKGLLVRHGNRPGNVSAGLDFVDLFSLCQRNHVEETIASPENGFAAANARRAIDVISR